MLFSKNLKGQKLNHVFSVDFRQRSLSKSITMCISQFPISGTKSTTSTTLKRRGLFSVVNSEGLVFVVLTNPKQIWHSRRIWQRKTAPFRTAGGRKEEGAADKTSLFCVMCPTSYCFHLGSYLRIAHSVMNSSMD